MRKNDAVRILDRRGNQIEATFVCLSYAKAPQHWQFRIKVPYSRSKTGFRSVNWYIPESRIVGIGG